MTLEGIRVFMKLKHAVEHVVYAGYRAAAVSCAAAACCEVRLLSFNPVRRIFLLSADVLTMFTSSEFPEE